MTPILRQKYWLTIPESDECYEMHKHWNSSVTNKLVQVTDINPLLRLNEVIVSYDDFHHSLVRGLIVPASWLSQRNPVDVKAKFCNCPLNLLVNQGCKCGGV